MHSRAFACPVTISQIWPYFIITVLSEDFKNVCMVLVPLKVYEVFNFQKLDFFIENWKFINFSEIDQWIFLKFCGMIPDLVSSQLPHTECIELVVALLSSFWATVHHLSAKSSINLSLDWNPLWTSSKIFCYLWDAFFSRILSLALFFWVKLII